MGKYLNPGNYGFQSAVDSQIYVDKSGLIRYTNRVLGTKQKFMCVSRARRFGKTMAEEMLAAYYGKGCDSRALFHGLEIEKEESFETHLNQYDVIFLDIQYMRELTLDAGRIGKKVSVVRFMQEEVLKELREAFPGCVQQETISLAPGLTDVFQRTGTRFIVIIDEWDCLFRTDKDDLELQEEYLSFLRSMFKGVQSDQAVLLAYMTGILPIKKYGTQSALNNFIEFTMAEPKALAEYVGFTESEVRELCEKNGMDFSEMQRWYDGYYYRNVGHVYNPKSVVEAILFQEYRNYWTTTETYESLRMYIEMNFDGLKDSVIQMLGGERCKVDALSFQNDMVSFHNVNDVLTLLIYLGYLAYDAEEREVFIPNEEIRDEFARAIQHTSWDEVVKALKKSDDLLRATWDMDEAAVAACLDEVHRDTTSILSYNNENSLSCVIAIAYYSARKYYTVVREMPAGKGFADLVFLPRSGSDKPAMVIELKWDRSAEGAIAQIRNKGYVDSLKGFEGEKLLVGINYDEEKNHSCRIEQISTGK